MKSFFYTLTHLAVLLVSASFAMAADETTPETFRSVEERRLEYNIIQERANVQKEREDIALQKLELKTLEDGVDKKLAEIDKKLEELANLQKKIETLLAAKSAEEKKRIENLAVIYDKMTPAKAAQALASLEQQLAADLLASMKVKSAAKILDQVAKQKTAELSKTFTTLQIE